MKKVNVEIVFKDLDTGNEVKVTFNCEDIENTVMKSQIDTQGRPIETLEEAPEAMFFIALLDGLDMEVGEEGISGTLRGISEE